MIIDCVVTYFQNFIFVSLVGTRPRRLFLASDASVLAGGGPDFLFNTLQAPSIDLEVCQCWLVTFLSPTVGGAQGYDGDLSSLVIYS